MQIQLSGDSIQIQTPSKLNLFLEVLGKREDGYHDLETFMTAIDRFDELTISIGQHKEIRLSCQWDSVGAVKADHSGWGVLPEDESNLVYRAAELFRLRKRISAGLDIRLVKSIPSQAGLGGASGNAAGTLLALDKLFSTDLSRQELMEWSAELGSDVPFFVEGGYALCEGRGERVTSLPDLRTTSFVVVKPDFGLSTPAVFSRLDTSRQINSIDLQTASEPGFEWSQHLFNRLEETATECYSEIGEICRFLKELGCKASAMTGSGSSCFGICTDRESAQQIADKFSKARSSFVFTCQNLPKFSVRG